MITKVFLGFIVIALAETANGIFRIRFLYKKIKHKRRANLVSFTIGVLIIFGINLLLLPWVNPRDCYEAFIIGLVWMCLMIAYDFYVGKILFKLSWKKIFDDFNILKGNLLGIGMLFILFLPLVIFTLN